jgi:thiamine kinase-like enzyme
MRQAIEKIINVAKAGSATLDLGDIQIENVRAAHSDFFSVAPLTKLNRISLKGEINSTKVKIFECSSVEHAKFVQKTMSSDECGKHFPDVFHRKSQILIVEWVEGENISWSNFNSNNELLEDLAKIQATFHSLKVEKSSFNYIEYLIKRLEKFKPILPESEEVELLINKVNFLREKLSSRPYKLSHPDFKPDNFVLDAKSNKLKIIDNELLTTSQIPVFDLFNLLKSMNAKKENLTFPYLEHYATESNTMDDIKQYPLAFSALWKVRMLGSFLLEGNLNAAVKSLESPITEEVKQNPLFSFLNVKL